MMNVVSNALPSGADVSTAATSASGKGTRSAKDDGFAKTLNSYGDGQNQRGKADEAKSDDTASTATQSNQDNPETDATTQPATAGARPFAMSVESMLSKATAPAPDAATPEAVLETPVVEGQEAEQPAVIDGADLDTATDLLADLQAAIPANTKGQGTPVRNNSADQTKTGEPDADATDATNVDAADDALALLQTPPEVPPAQPATVIDQQNMQAPTSEIETTVDADDMVSQVGTTQTLKDAASATSTNTAATDAGKTGQKSAATAADAASSVRDTLQQDSEPQADIETPAIQVTENRRYVGIAPSSNALSLATAFGQDPDWSSAMNASAKLSNEALYASTGKVVNTLKIELNPIDLGQVTATMRMVGEELNIHLTVESSKAYRQILNDSSSMLDNLKAQGYSVDQITVSIASGSSSTSDKGSDTFANARQQSDMAQQQQQQQNGRQGGNTGGGSADAPDTVVRGSSSGGKDEGLATGAGLGGSGARPDTVYL